MNNDLVKIVLAMQHRIEKCEITTKQIKAAAEISQKDQNSKASDVNETPFLPGLVVMPLVH